MAAKEHWKTEPDDHDYPAATDYLSLIMDKGEVTNAVAALRKAPIIHAKAKDLLRASRLELLPPDNVHVKKDLGKVSVGALLSPVLLVRGRMDADVPLTIADGFHRICASYHLDEKTEVMIG